jgi:molecular chaperone DnaJ
MDMFFSGSGFGGGFGGQSSRRRRRVRGENIEYPVKITFLEAVFGVKKEIKYKRMEPCVKCDGKGGKGVRTCTTCRGTGQETRTTRSILGLMQQIVTCSQCGGSGDVISQPCPVCKGRKVTAQSHTTKVSIPAGVESNMALNVQGRGHVPEANAIPGDLHVILRVKPDSRFERDGYDIHTSVDISFINAIKGCSVSIETVDGSIKIKIEPGTQANTQLRLRGKGIPTLESQGNRRGNHYVRVNVKIPDYSKIKKDQKTLINEYEALLLEKDKTTKYHSHK